MTSMGFILLCRECESILRARAPYKTGNLRYNAIKLEMIDEYTCRLYVDDEYMAPYMPYTNEPWVNRPGKNPNEGWFDKAAEEIAQHIARRLGGQLKS